MRDNKTNQQYYTVVFSRSALAVQQSLFLDDKFDGVKQMPTLDIPNFEKMKYVSLTEEDEQPKSGRRYNHWSFTENLQLLLQFIILESLNFAKVQELFQHRDIHACRVKWTNDLMRFNIKGYNYSWRTFLIGMVLDFHALVAVKSNPVVAPHFSGIKARILTIVYSLDYPCFMTSTDYRQQISELIISAYKESIPLCDLEASLAVDPSNTTLTSFIDMLKTSAFALSRKVNKDTKDYEQFLREIKRKAAKIIID